MLDLFLRFCGFLFFPARHTGLVGALRQRLITELCEWNSASQCFRRRCLKEGPGLAGDQPLSTSLTSASPGRASPHPDFRALVLITG